MLLGSRLVANNDLRLIRVNYSQFLKRGATIVTVAVTVPVGTVSTVGSVTYDPDRDAATFLVTAGAVNETFTVAVVMTDTTGQTVNDTLQVQVVAP